MTKKIFKSIFIVATAVLLAALVLIFGVLYNHFNSIEESQLKTDAKLAQQGLEVSGIKYLETLQDKDVRITWIDASGTVLYDTQHDAKTMDNHKDREEVKAAFETGYGESQRYSSTLTEKTLYYAKLLDDGSVLRVSKDQDSVLTLVYGMIQPILFILVLALIISAIIAARVSKRIVEPLNKIALDNPLENEVYDELAPLLRTIENQHRQISRQIIALQKKQTEFEAVTENMGEGLVLLGKDEKIISINKSAQAFFATTDYCIGSDFITIERSTEIEDAIKNAYDDGISELHVQRNGREYQLNITRIEESDKIALGDDILGSGGTARADEAAGNAVGVVVLIFDITEKVFAERNRQEFTANVTHELKTPLHSIMGSAELMQNGLVKPDDMPEFIGRIRFEAARLVTLIEDIIHLSQLDEQVELVTEKVDLYSKAAEEVEALRHVAAEKDINISLQGESVTVEVAPQLLHEVIYNLCDNAIKYNVVGGNIDVTIGKGAEFGTSQKSGTRLESGTDGGHVSDTDSPSTGWGWILVEDTGIGIAPEHLERIFERFYRVDKSHSKETGGTGLGLSIVKHAVEDMKGTIEVNSTEGIGTSIKVLLPM